MKGRHVDKEEEEKVVEEFKGDTFVVFILTLLLSG